MLLGDVFSVIAAIVGIAICAWALLLCVSVFFVRRTNAASQLIMASPVKLTLIGLGAALLVGGGGLALISQPLPLLKLVGWVMVLWLMAVSFTGSAGLVKIGGERILELDRRLSSYAAMSRGAMFLILSSIFPVLGWFLFGPIIFCLGIGAGLRVIRLKEEAVPTATMV
jgi:hypothetical protein